MKLICDSGSSKASWAAIYGEKVFRFEGSGLNPHVLTVQKMEELLRNEVLHAMEGLPGVSELYFYGAGCNAAGIAVLKPVLETVFDCPALVDSDLTGSALSVLGLQRGVVAILGTGSNSGLFEGGILKERIPALGYILGDEGSGANLGRQLVSDFFKLLMPSGLRIAFSREYSLTEGEAIRKVYGEPAPNRYLASFVPFILKHRTEPYMQELLLGAFQKLVDRNLLYYKQFGVDTVAFTGSVAAIFRAELAQVLERSGFTTGTVVQYPIEGLIEYYSK